jgi:hypothetical protein
VKGDTAQLPWAKLVGYALLAVTPVAGLLWLVGSTAGLGRTAGAVAIDAARNAARVAPYPGALRASAPPPAVPGPSHIPRAVPPDHMGGAPPR